MASEHGLILVDTKYEFGKSNDGTVMLIDEVELTSCFSCPYLSSPHPPGAHFLEHVDIDKQV